MLFRSVRSTVLSKIHRVVEEHRPTDVRVFYNGDPEWIGILDYPGVPHGPTNRFVGRFAYIILPASKSLDLNSMHNQAKRLGGGTEGYWRNQGFGSWEINLAAFLFELNSGPTAWSLYNYQSAPPMPAPVSSGGIEIGRAHV